MKSGPFIAGPLRRFAGRIALSASVVLCAVVVAIGAYPQETNAIPLVVSICLLGIALAFGVDALRTESETELVCAYTGLTVVLLTTAALVVRMLEPYA